MNAKSEDYNVPTIYAATNIPSALKVALFGEAGKFHDRLLCATLEIRAQSLPTLAVDLGEDHLCTVKPMGEITIEGAPRLARFNVQLHAGGSFWFKVDDDALGRGVRWQRAADTVRCF